MLITLEKLTKYSLLVRIIFFKLFLLVAPPQERSDLSGHYGVRPLVCLVGWFCVGGLGKKSNLQNFIEFQKFQN